MNLHQLVSLRNQLRQALETSIIKLEIENNFTRLKNLSENDDFELNQLVEKLADNHLSHLNELDNDFKNLQSIIELVQTKIDALSYKFFGDNYQIELKCPSIDILEKTRILTSFDQFNTIILQRINLHSNWQYPALEIGCRNGEWTKFLVASDPLYIADVYEEFLMSAVKQFPDVYQGRVRKYIINNLTDISGLPSDQFGLIFSYNFFNYLSLDSIKQLLIHSLEWLRPGGKIIFTYNNADLPAGAAYAENFFMTYVPQSILQPMAESLGYETTFSYNFDPAFSLIEFKKSGQLKSIKLSQAMAEIKSKSFDI